MPMSFTHSLYLDTLLPRGKLIHWGMNFYIATRFSNEDFRQQALEIKDKLEAAGHKMTFDWMNGKTLKPYSENVEITREASQMALNGALEADLFILIPEPGGTGMYVEFGAALAKSLTDKNLRIYLLGPYKDYVLFNYHPSVVWKDSIEEILAEI